MKPVRLIGLLFTLTGTSVLFAADPEPTPTPPVAPAPESALTLTMSEAVVRALDANLEVQIERIQPAIAEQQFHYKMGAFDPHLTAHYTSEQLETPQHTRDFFATGRAVE